MLKNFHLAVIVKRRPTTVLYRVPLDSDLQSDLALSWAAQLSEFVTGADIVDFNAGYNLERHERFRLNGYQPPEWLAGTHSENVEHLSAIKRDERFLDSIAGVFAAARSEDDDEVMLFQNFKRSKVIRPRRTLILAGNTFNRTEHTGLMLDDVLSAVLLPNERRLLFSSFYTVNTFLPLADFYKEASEREIVEILDHRMFDAVDPETTAAESGQWFRKRFAILRESCVLETYTAEQIQQKAAAQSVAIRVTGDKIQFPVEKGEARRLLQFLCEELYRGPITDTLYETNSKRAATA